MFRWPHPLYPPVLLAAATKQKPQAGTYCHSVRTLLAGVAATIGVLRSTCLEGLAWAFHSSRLRHDSSEPLLQVQQRRSRKVHKWKSNTHHRRYQSLRKLSDDVSSGTSRQHFRCQDHKNAEPRTPGLRGMEDYASGPQDIYGRWTQSYAYRYVFKASMADDAARRSPIASKLGPGWRSLPSCHSTVEREDNLAFVDTLRSSPMSFIYRAVLASDYTPSQPMSGCLGRS